MGICSKCGIDNSNDEIFCRNCGANLSDHSMVDSHKNLDCCDMIDLRGQSENSRPAEESYRASLITGILVIPVLLLMVILGRKYCETVDAQKVIWGMILVSAPLAICSFLLLLPAKKKAEKTARKVEKGLSAGFYITSVFTVSFALLCGFAPVFSEVGFLPIVLTFFSVVCAIVFFVFCYVMSFQQGEEGYYCLVKALFISSVISTPIAYLLGHLMRLAELGFIAFFVLLAVFFLLGGRLIIVRYR